MVTTTLKNAGNSKRLFESSAVKIESPCSHLASFVVDDEYIFLCSYLTTNSNSFALRCSLDGTTCRRLIKSYAIRRSICQFYTLLVMVLTSIINLKLDTRILRLILKYKTNEFLMILANITTWITIKNYGLISKLIYRI